MCIMIILVVTVIVFYLLLPSFVTPSDSDKHLTSSGVVVVGDDMCSYHTITYRWI